MRQNVRNSWLPGGGADYIFYSRRLILLDVRRGSKCLRVFEPLESDVVCNGVLAWMGHMAFI